jgi:hypothetical protein
MTLTKYYTKISAMDIGASRQGRIDDLLEMAHRIKWSRINEPRPWTQRKIRELVSALEILIMSLKGDRPQTADGSSKIKILSEAKALFADMPWKENEVERWYQWEKTLDNKIDEFIQKMEALKAQP